MPCCFDSLSPRRESSMSGAIHRAHRATLPKSRVRESRTSGSVRGAPGDRRLYSPKSLAKQGLHEIWRAETRAKAERAFDQWLERYRNKCPKATACLARDRDELLAFYDFPAAHRTHLRTTNVIESAFATNPPPKLASQGLRHPKDRALDDLQDGSVRGEILALAPWIPPAREGRRRRQVQRRHRGHRGPQSRRMNNPSYTRFNNSP